MKGTIFVNIFMAAMVLIGSAMQPANNYEDQPEIETSIVEVESF